MPKLTIDQHEVEVPAGATILEAAEKLGIEIPTLCFLKPYRPSTSCLACVVQVNGSPRLVPACATVATDGMQVRSDAEDVREARRTALELLLSDHLGDCLAPCDLACPAQMDIPRMLRQIAAGQYREAIETVKRDIALPAILGRICPAPCEKACRRRQADDAVSICLLKRFVADTDLATGEPFVPECMPASGKRVAIIGAGPSGLAASYYLQQLGHACTLFDENEKLGGRLWQETDETQLPRDVLEAETGTILRLGAELHSGTRVSSLDDLRGQFDAVLVACGATGSEQAGAWSLNVAKRGIEVVQGTYVTNLDGVFAVGNAIRTKGMVIRSAADGKEVAASIDQYLAGLAVTGPAKRFNSRIGRLEPEELSQFVASASAASRSDPAGGTVDGYTADEAGGQAARCLHCDCRALATCKLRKYAAEYGADPRRYQADRRPFEQDLQHADVIFEPGKCIACGLCIEIARTAEEPLGLTFIGRGFNVRVGVPLDGTLREALNKVAAECVAACPTAALAHKDETD